LHLSDRLYNLLTDLKSNNLYNIRQMKTFFEKLFVHFEMISHPAGGWFKSQENSRKRKGQKSDFRPVPSPESFNVRGGNKKGRSLRETPAP